VAGKLFERIVAARIVWHLSREGDVDLSERQYGFRGGRSTVDAICRVRAFAEAKAREGRVIVAVIGYRQRI